MTHYIYDLSIVLSIYLSIIYLSCYLSASLSVYLSVHLSVYISIRLSICPSIHLSICLSVYPSIRVSVCLSIYPSVHLSIHLSICRSFYLPTYLFIYLPILCCAQMHQDRAASGWGEASAEDRDSVHSLCRAPKECYSVRPSLSDQTISSCLSSLPPGLLESCLWNHRGALS